MGLSKQGEEGNITLLTDMKTEEVKTSPVEGFSLIANEFNFFSSSGESESSGLGLG